jgi:hypothetical protein
MKLCEIYSITDSCCTHYFHKWISCISIQDFYSLSHNLYLSYSDENYFVEHLNMIDEYFTSKDCFQSSSHSLSWDDKSFKSHWFVCCNWILKSAHSWIVTWLSILRWEMKTFWKFCFFSSTLSDRLSNSWLSMWNINCVTFNSAQSMYLTVRHTAEARWVWLFNEISDDFDTFDDEMLMKQFVNDEKVIVNHTLLKHHFIICLHHFSILHQWYKLS